jgi:tetratricopeptide (TPR) repeat protein
VQWRWFGNGLCMLLVWLCALQAPARAENADALVREGVQLRKQGKDLEAYGLFQRAVGLEKTPRALAQVGLCEQALGLWAKAEAHIDEALAAETDPWIRKNRVALEGSVRTIGGHLGTVEIWGAPAGAEVSFNGARVGTLPDTGSVRVEVGQVTVFVRAQGYAAVTRTLKIESGDERRENVVLQATAAALPVAALALAPPPAPAPPTLVGGRGASPGDEERAPPIYTRWWFWTAIAALAAAGVATAIVLGRGHGTSCDAQATACSTF